MNLLAKSIRRRIGYRCNPFGIILESSGLRAEEFRFRFSTKYHEPVSGLVLYQKRAYCPELGRWLSRDPIGEEGGLNLYGFCGNDSINLFDKTGLDIWIGTRMFGLHYNINIGDRNGDYYSYSFQLTKALANFNPFNEDGQIYADSPPEETLRGYCIKTTKEQDRKALRLMEAMKGDKMRYVLNGSTCRSFSLAMYDFLKAGDF